ncbi:sushi, von Willebrand factor type A, EGF and pentraxin domain-containing protein 1 [Elysia marginata]|uniref:Sushi, von Willebrand factor type A, EGF and pentraxin domain-containing protein 1 n=1 Tax=Elysia marginata TaxID=1093978 RepID=A0AAV4EXP5_9GAST|nr:sushi, von Willebrand factor type A, EGF and pentraxin domain-containing protein 1 [Elysia marginata]
MRLAVLETEADFNYWQQWFHSQAPTSDVWVGAKFSAAQNAWWWDAGFAVSLTFFSPSPPDTAGVHDGGCLALYSNQYLAELACGETRGFLCQENYAIEVATEGTTESPRLPSPGENGYCTCGCTGNFTNTPHTDSEKQSYLKKRDKEIKRKLFVDTKVLSANLRRATSAEDDRQSAKSVGYIGVVLLVLTFGSVLLADVVTIWKDFKSCTNTGLRQKC